MSTTTTTTNTTTLLRPDNATPGAPSFKQWVSLKAYGLFTSTLFGAMTSPHRMRKRFERFGAVPRDAIQQKHPNVRFSDHKVGALGIERVVAVQSPSRVIIHLHGGGYFMGSPASYRNRAMRLGFRCDAEVFVPDYRLAPEHPYPAALEDAVVAWQYIKALRPGMPIFITGDSAGGGLALSLLVRLKQLGEAMPDGAILLSPWTDLSGSGSSYDANAGKDLWLSKDHLHQWSSYYAATSDRRDPLLSPVFADLAGLPPLFLIVGGDEVLLDDALRVAARARVAGTRADLLVGRGMQHDFPLTLPFLAESRRAWKQMARFVDAYSARLVPAAGAL